MGLFQLACAYYEEASQLQMPSIGLDKQSVLTGNRPESVNQPLNKLTPLEAGVCNCMHVIGDEMSLL